METQQWRTITYKGFGILNDLNPNFMERNVLSFSKYNSQKRQSLCSFPKHSNGWKQKLR